MKTIISFYFATIIISIISSGILHAQCDSMDGPVVTDAKRAIDSSNINYVLKWVKPEYEKEIIGVFFQVMIVRSLSPESKQLADNYMFETIVKLHLIGEGIPFTYVKPSGTPADRRIVAANKSIELGDLTPLNGMIAEDRQQELKEKFDLVMALKNYDINDLATARKYVEAYDQFSYFAEDYEGLNPSFFGNPKYPNTIIPWLLSGFLLITSLILGYLYAKKP